MIKSTHIYASLGVKIIREFLLRGKGDFARRTIDFMAPMLMLAY